MFTSLAGRSVVVTGGSKGIGRGIATVFARAGARVLVTGRDEESLATACASIGGETSFVVADVSRREDCDRMAATAVERHGDRKSTRLNSSHTDISRMPSSA